MGINMIVVLKTGHRFVVPAATLNGFSVHQGVFFGGGTNLRPETGDFDTTGRHISLARIKRAMGR